MSSYAKQMMELAQQWLAVNPDPSTPFLNLPGLDKDKARPEPDLDRYERLAKQFPDMREQVEEVKRTTALRDAARASLQARELELVRAANAPRTPGHSKGVAEIPGDERRTLLGRWCLAWARTGHNVIELSADFTAAMLMTDSSDLDIESVRMPFPGLLFMIPDGFARGAEGRHYTRVHVTEIPRHDAVQIEVGQRMAAVLDPLPPQEKDAVLRYAIDKLKSDADAPPSLVAPKATDPLDTVLHLHATDGAHVLDTVIDRKGLSWKMFDQLPEHHLADEQDKLARHTIRRIVFGALAYMTAIPHAMEAVDPARKRPTATPRTSPTRWTVGRTIKVGPHLVRLARSGAREIEFELKSGHWVTGHYKRQVHGVGRSERTRRWIAPYYRGPEDGAVLVHTYRLEETEGR